MARKTTPVIVVLGLWSADRPTGTGAGRIGPDLWRTMPGRKA